MTNGQSNELIEERADRAGRLAYNQSGQKTEQRVDREYGDREAHHVTNRENMTGR
jgi:hypothetical protein